MNDFIKRIQSEFARDFTLTGLRLAIVMWSIVIAISALSINNKWILAGILAYEVLP
jgi:hypothetical protein